MKHKKISRGYGVAPDLTGTAPRVEATPVAAAGVRSKSLSNQTSGNGRDEKGRKREREERGRAREREGGERGM